MLAANSRFFFFLVQMRIQGWNLEGMHWILMAALWVEIDRSVCIRGFFFEMSFQSTTQFRVWIVAWLHSWVYFPWWAQPTKTGLHVLCPSLSLSLPLCSVSPLCSIVCVLFFLLLGKFPFPLFPLGPQCLLKIGSLSLLPGVFLYS